MNKNTNLGMNREPQRNRTAIYIGHATAGQSREVERRIRSTFNVVLARHLDFGDYVDERELARLRADFLFSFGPHIVRGPLLHSIGTAAINFHPAPPTCPGRGSASRAIFNGYAEFGVTAHLMVEEIDAGPILRVHRFPILSDDDAGVLRAKAFEHVPELVRTVIADLRQNNFRRPEPNGEVWSGPANRKKDVEALIHITAGDSAETIRRKRRAGGC